MTCKTDWLLAVGCSLTWGSEITQPGESLEQDKLSAWPAHLGNLLKANTIINRGYPGRSNNSIYRVAVQELANYKNKLGNNGILIVQWSGEMRLEFFTPFRFDLKKFYKDSCGQHHHPGPEGSYFCVSPNEILDIKIQQSFAGLHQYFFNYWAHQHYQQELLINYSLSLTGLANKLGIKILQFNGIDEIIPDIIPDHASAALSLIDNEYFHPFDRSYAFWNHVTNKFPRAPVWNKNGTFPVPPHPDALQHQIWADKLYEYLQTVSII